MSRLTPLLSGQPDEIDLELRLLGALDDADAAAVDAAIDGELADAAAELEAFRAAWSQVAPGLPSPAPRRRWSAWVRPALALAAAALLAVGIGLLWPQPDLGVRPMGGLPVDVIAMRQANPLEAPYRLAAGDQLRVALVAPADGFVDVWTLQEDGQVSVLELSRPVVAGERFVLAGAAQLDQYEGQEWLIVQLDSSRRTQAQLERQARTLLPDPPRSATDRRWVLEVTRWR